MAGERRERRDKDGEVEEGKEEERAEAGELRTEMEEEAMKATSSFSSLRK